MTTLVWLQRELRLDYLPALTEALATDEQVILAYFHDPKQVIGEANSLWLAHGLTALQQDIQAKGGCLWIVAGNFQDNLSTLLQTYNINQVFYSFQVGNPFSQMQQQALETCQKLKVRLKPFFSEFWLKPTDFSNQKGQPYLVFTPFYKALLKQQHQLCPLDRCAENLDKTKQIRCPSPFSELPHDLTALKQQPWAHKIMQSWQVGETPAWQIFNHFLHDKVAHYLEERDYPAIEATSRLSPHLHFGHLPARQLYFELQSFMQSHPNQANEARSWLRQLAWREFARHLLFWFPQTQTAPFQAKYQQMAWRGESDEQDIFNIQSWQRGLTGIPIIDAGMRELWETGTMHNRVRMLVASFLTKNLNHHWLVGQRWFEETLLDADPANNVMGWQWVAGCGVDAAPYYRLFNPVRQSMKFDADANYLRHWLPEIAALSDKAIHQPWENLPECELKGIVLGITYPKPICDLAKTQKAHLKRVESLKSLKNQSF